MWPQSPLACVTPSFAAPGSRPSSLCPSWCCLHLVAAQVFPECLGGPQLRGGRGDGPRSRPAPRPLSLCFRRSVLSFAAGRRGVRAAGRPACCPGRSGFSRDDPAAAGGALPGEGGAGARCHQSGQTCPVCSARPQTGTPAMTALGQGGGRGQRGEWAFVLGLPSDLRCV